MFCGSRRAISVKLDKNTISLFVKTQNVGFSVFSTLFLLHDPIVFLIVYFKCCLCLKVQTILKLIINEVNFEI